MNSTPLTLARGKFFLRSFSFVFDVYPELRLFYSTQGKIDLKRKNHSRV